VFARSGFLQPSFRQDNIGLPGTNTLAYLSRRKEIIFISSNKPEGLSLTGKTRKGLLQKKIWVGFNICG
jgi:hypothetical protein